MPTHQEFPERGLETRLAELRRSEAQVLLYSAAAFVVIGTAAVSLGAATGGFWRSLLVLLPLGWVCGLAAVAGTLMVRREISREMSNLPPDSRFPPSPFR